MERSGRYQLTPVSKLDVTWIDVSSGAIRSIYYRSYEVMPQMFDMTSNVRKHLEKSKIWDLLKATGLDPLKKLMPFKAKKMEVV